MNWASNVAYVLFITERHNFYNFYICLYVYDLVYICFIYVNYFAIIIFIFVAINHIISLKQTNLFFGHVCQKFSLRVFFHGLILLWFENINLVMRNPILKFRQSSIVFKKPGFLFQKFRHGFSPVNLLHIFRTPFLKNTSEWLLLTVVLH